VILVDSGIWISHLRTADATLAGLLRAGQVLLHPCVLGELALGHIRNRTELLRELHRMKLAIVARDDEVLSLIERERLAGLGIGYVDACLLAATRLTAGAALWSGDRKLADAAAQLGVSWQPE
jgi:predicted nucleic acid-binding protein